MAVDPIRLEHPKSFEKTYEDVIAALAKLGKVQARKNSQVTGTVKYGIHNVKLIISVASESSQSVVTIACAEKDTTVVSTDAKIQSAFSRFVDTLKNIDDPDFKPDKLGLSPKQMRRQRIEMAIGVVIIVIFVVVGIALKERGWDLWDVRFSVSLLVISFVIIAFIVKTMFSKK